MKKLFLAPFLLAIFLFVAVLWWIQNSKPVSGKTEMQDFLIVRGASAGQIANKLHGDGLIKSPLAFKIYVQVTNKQNKIQAGEFRLSPSFSLQRIVEELESGPTEVWVTIPEGFRREEIAKRFASVLEKDEQFTVDFLNVTQGQEGLLFPDTYLFAKEASPSAVANKLRSTFDSKLSAKMRQDIAELGYTMNQVVTMASIVERETLTGGERPVVAGILYKRLRAGWPLQADATLQYAVANAKCQMPNAKCENWWQTPTSADKEINSAYNTYRSGGLPPGPIANPGLSSLEAAIYPEDSPYWYYIHDRSGKIHYAVTLEEHNENIRRYLR